MTTRTATALNPYVGPRPFSRLDVEHGLDLFGRDWEARELLDLLIGKRIVLLFSPSGAGKTSLIQAKLIPSLEREAFEVLPVIRVCLEPETVVGEPGGRPAVNRYVVSTIRSLETDLPEEQWTPTEHLAGTTLAEYLDQRWPTLEESKPRVLIFDQLEEIFADPTDREAKEEFFAQLGDALHDPGRWALVTMREDYLGELEPYLRLLPTRFGTRFRLSLLEAPAALEAIKGPARLAGVRFTDPAAGALVDNLRIVRIQGPEGVPIEQPGPYIEPVQLQVICRRLWEKLPADHGEIREEDIESIGDVSRALAEYYAERVEEIADTLGLAERAIREWIDDHLITAQGIRGQALLETDGSGGLDKSAVDWLVDVHLLRAEKRRGETWLELAHDRLVGPVRTNNEAWLQSHLSPLERQAQLWEKQGRPDSLLFVGDALVEGERWIRDNPGSGIESEFVAASRRAAAERRTGRFRRWAIGAMVVGTLLCFALVVTVGSYCRAEGQAKLALARQLAAQAEVIRLRQAHLLPHSVLLAVEAMQRSPSLESDQALRGGLALLPRRVARVPHQDRPRPVAFAPDAKYAATVTEDWTVRVWDVDGAPVARLPHGSAVLAMALSSDGHYAATAGTDGAARVWEVAGQREVARLAHEARVSAVAFALDGQRVATASADRTARVWETAGGRQVARLDHDAPVSTIAFSPDGQRVATVSDDRTARIWEPGAGAVATVLRGHAGRVLGVAFSPDGRRVATASDDRTARVWDVAGGGEVARLPHQEAVSAVAFSPDGLRVATASEDRTARIWEVAGGGEVARLTHEDPVVAVAFSPDGRYLATASADRAARLWEAAGGQEVTQLAQEGGVLAVAFSPDRRYLATASDDRAARHWEALAGTVVAVLRGHDGPVLSTAFSPDGQRVATASADRTARIWEVAGGRQVARLDHEAPVSAIAFDPDGQQVGTASIDLIARVWGASTGQRVAELRGHTGPVYSAVFSPDGRFVATASADGTARVWEAGTGTVVAELRGHDGPVLATAFSPPDGRLVATAGRDGIARVWEAGDEVARLNHEGPVAALAFSPDGRYLATASADRSARIWELAGGRQVARLDHAGPVTAVAFSPDGRYVGTASDDRNGRVWEAGGREVARLAHEGGVAAVGFSPDGRYLVSVDKARTARVWLLRPEDLIARACERLTRNLTSEEWRQYLGEDEPRRETCPSLSSEESNASRP